MPPTEMLCALRQIACGAGGCILPFFQNNFSYQLKADKSPVTEADLASHAFIVKALSALSPRLPVVSEESSGEEAVTENRTGKYWLVDPLDGTKEFMKGKPEFTVNIALIRDCAPMLGIVHAPALGLTYLAESGAGAWRQAARSPAVPIHTRKADLHHMTVVASKDHSGPRVKHMLEKLPSPGVTSIGSSLKFCLLAEGKADLYFRDLPTMEWDTAAAQCVVEAAGGLILEIDGEPMRYGKPDLRNRGFVAVGDPDFRWTDLAFGPENAQAFKSFFAEICNEANG